MKGTRVFKHTLLSVVIAAASTLPVKHAFAAECSGTPATKGGDIVISTGQGETCNSVSINASPDEHGKGRTGNITVTGTIKDSGDNLAGLSVTAAGQFENDQANTGNIINTGLIETGDDGIRAGHYTQSLTGTIGDIINAGDIKVEDNGISLHLTENARVGHIENRKNIQSSTSRGIITSLYGNSHINSVVNSGSIKSGDDDDAVILLVRENSSVGSVTNSGDIEAGYWGLAVQANTEHDATGWAEIGDVTNSGTINAKEDALYASATKGTIGDVVNSGRLVSQNDYGLYIRTSDEGVIGTVTNSGYITSINDYAVSIDGNAHTFINTGTIKGNTKFQGNDNTFIVAGGLLDGDVAGPSTIHVAGSAQLTGNIASTQPYYSNINGVNYVRFGSDEEYQDFLARSAASNITIENDGRLQLSKDKNQTFEISLHQQGSLAITVGTTNNLANDNPQAKLTLQPQVVRVGDEQSSELASVTNPTASFSEGAAIMVTPDYRGDFAYGDTKQYRALTASGGITGTPTTASSSILFTAVEAGDSNDQNMDVTVSTTDLSRAVEEDDNDDMAVQVAGALQNYLNSLDQQAAANFMDDEQLLAISDVDGLVTYLQEHYPNTDTNPLSAVIAATGQIQAEVFNNILARLASMRAGGGSGIATGDLTEQDSVWVKAISSTADQDKQSRRGVTYNGYKSRLTGINIGGDTDISDTYTVGASFSYGEADVDVKNSSARSDIKSYQLSLYSNWQQNDWFIDSVVNAGINAIDATSHNGAIKATSDYKSQQYGLHLTGGRAYWFNDQDTLVEPQLSLEYSHLKTDDYTVNYSDNSPSDRVKSDDFNVLELGAGVRIQHLLEMDNGALLPEASLMLLHDVIGDKVESSVTSDVFDQSLTFRTLGVEPERTSYLASVGVDYWMDNDFSLSLNYEHRWASGFKSDSTQAEVRYDF